MPEAVSWSTQMEIELFHAILTHKPVGVDRHFQMIYIKSLLNSRPCTNKLTTSQLWEKLDSLYNMDELHESEVNPFQFKIKEFCLPEEFTELRSKPFPRADSDPASLKTKSLAESGNYNGVRSSGQKRTRKWLRSSDPAFSTPPGTPNPSSEKSETPGSAGESQPRKKRRQI
ncbi:unnamed protein product [Dicrocoelium dendriticum]|nr:unnamed protein product [Dicrocoelium dendriticum]